MKKHVRRIRLGSLWALCACLALLWFFPSVLRGTNTEDALPRAQRQLVTVWICGDTLNASSWVKGCASAYQKAHEGVNVWVRTVSQADMALLEADYAHAAPDLLLFMAGEEIAPEWVQGEIAPLCMAGYALVQKSQSAATVAPTSLFGVTPTPEQSPSATIAPRESWPQRMAADDQLGSRMLLEIGAPRGAQLLPAEQVSEALLQGPAQAALLSTVQIRKLIASGQGLDLLCAAPGSDLVLFGTALQGSSSQAGDFLSFLQQKESQQKLSDKGLFSPCGAVLYGADKPILQAVEAALRGGWLPDPLLWPLEKGEYIQSGQLLYME